MRISPIVVVTIFLCLFGCSFFKSAPPTPPLPIFEGRTATLNIINRIDVAASVSLPRGFVPSSAIPPMWLAHGFTVAVAGMFNNKAVVLGFSGAGHRKLDVIASDFGPGAQSGRIVAVAASPDGMELATAVAVPRDHRLDLSLIDSIDGGQGHVVAAFDGDVRVVSMNWLDPATIAIAIQAQASTPSAPDVEAAAVVSASGLYIVGISGVGSIAHLSQIKCSLGPLNFSSNRRYAVSEGGPDIAPALIDLRADSCTEIRAAAPIRALGWAPDSSAVLYAATDRNGKNAAVFRLTVATAQRKLIAISSSAAAYASDGTIVAMGNSRLSWARVARVPDKPAKAEIALIDPQAGEINFNSLGFKTLPAMFAQSTMVYSAATDSAVIDTFVPGPAGAVRDLIDYSYPTRSAFVLAAGDARGPLMMSWSPDGRALALVDGDAAHAMLTVMIPPR
jgi:hypothetical protein